MRILRELEGYRPGRCALCDEPLPPKKRGVRGRDREMCGSLECRRTYDVVWRAAHRDRELREER